MAGREPMARFTILIALVSWIAASAPTMAQGTGSVSPIGHSNPAVHFCPGPDLESYSCAVALVDLPSGSAITALSTSLEPPSVPSRAADRPVDDERVVSITIERVEDEGEAQGRLVLRLDAEKAARVSVYVAWPGATAWEPLTAAVVADGTTTLPLVSVEALEVLGGLAVMVVSPDARIVPADDGAGTEADASEAAAIASVAGSAPDDQ